MTLPIPLDYAPMEAKSVASLPEGGAWQYEPKWDGFRCLAFKDGTDVHLRSKSGQPFERYFPEIVAAVAELPARHFVLDGELVIPEGNTLSFDHLLMRIHPAESRVRKLAHEHPARYVAFDLLVDASGRSLVESPLAKRRDAQSHKRWMLLATINLVTAASARWPLIGAFGPPAYFGLTDVFIVALAVWDIRTRGRLHPATLWGGLSTIISQPLRLIVSGTPAWLEFARFATGLPG